MSECKFTHLVNRSVGQSVDLSLLGSETFVFVAALLFLSVMNLSGKISLVN